MGNSIVSYCTQAFYVFYQGTIDFPSASTVFLGRSLQHSHTLCQQYRGNFSSCYKPLYINSNKSFVLQTRKNATGCESSEESECNPEKYEELSAQNNHCYDIVCEDEHWVFQKKVSAAEWESLAGECMKNICDNETGKNLTEQKHPEEYEELSAEDNHCYDIVCEDEHWFLRKIQNVRDWEN